MPAITLSDCPCPADPNCPQCKGSGSYESEENRARRATEQHGCDAWLDKADAIEDAGIDWDALSDKEFEEWTPEADSSHLIERSECLRKSKAIETEKRNIEFAKMEEGNKIARQKLRQIRRNLNSFER